MTQQTLSADFNLKTPRGLCTPRAYLEQLFERQDNSLTEHGIDTWAEGYAEPGYTQPKRGILFGNWNEPRNWTGKRHRSKPCRIVAVAEAAGYECEWSDEWSTCDSCNKAVRTTADSYGWRKSYYLANDCEIVCKACALEDLDTYEEQLINDLNLCDTFDVDWAARGWTKFNGSHYEHGWHPGQTDTPAKVVKLLPAGQDYLFTLPTVGQFDLAFDVWIRPEGYEQPDV